VVLSHPCSPFMGLDLLSDSGENELTNRVRLQFVRNPKGSSSEGRGESSHEGSWYGDVRRTRSDALEPPYLLTSPPKTGPS